ncbi:hypothetical protein T492DRAFT_861201 [Pavlovales sp. CCMP2436]|nr:hypothetical protein T492DRAFT_861201 [Pavlovales sp. CCMP2436]
MMLAACVCLAVAYAGGTNSIGRVARPAAARVRAVLEQPPAPTAAAPSVVSALRSALRRGEDLGELLAATQPFPLDGFQLDALTAGV